eukprot:2262156-Prymnesium_polylepis.1
MRHAETISSGLSRLLRLCEEYEHCLTVGQAHILQVGAREMYDSQSSLWHDTQLCDRLSG